VFVFAFALLLLPLLLRLLLLRRTVLRLRERTSWSWSAAELMVDVALPVEAFLEMRRLYVWAMTPGMPDFGWGGVGVGRGGRRKVAVELDRIALAASRAEPTGNWDIGGHWPRRLSLKGMFYFYIL